MKFSEASSILSKYFKNDRDSRHHIPMTEIKANPQIIEAIITLLQHGYYLISYFGKYNKQDPMLLELSENKYGYTIIGGDILDEVCQLQPLSVSLAGKLHLVQIIQNYGKTNSDGFITISWNAYESNSQVSEAIDNALDYSSSFKYRSSNKVCFCVTLDSNKNLILGQFNPSAIYMQSLKNIHTY